MNHISEDILIEFADGLLDAEKQKETELHLQQCPACRKELEMYRSLSVVMEKGNVLMAPPALVNQVMYQVELHQHIMLRKAKSRRTAFRFAGIMLGFLAAMFGLGLLIDHGTGSVIQIPTYIVDALNYLKGFEFSVKNPLILYVAVSVIILLVSERIIRSFKPRKIAV
jgi:hypothetical protein